MGIVSKRKLDLLVKSMAASMTVVLTKDAVRRPMLKSREYGGQSQ